MDIRLTTDGMHLKMSKHQICELIIGTSYGSNVTTKMLHSRMKTLHNTSIEQAFDYINQCQGEPDTASDK